MPPDKSYKLAYGLCAACNDRVYIFIKHDKSQIQDACWQSIGSHLLDMSTQVLLNQIRGKTFDQTLEIIKDFKQQLFSGNLNESYSIFRPYYKFPTRLKSIILPYEVIEKALGNLINDNG